MNTPEEIAAFVADPANKSWRIDIQATALGLGFGIVVVIAVIAFIAARG